MEFSAGTKSLAEALDQVQEAVEKKSTIPILSHVLVEGRANGLRLAAPDLDARNRLVLQASVIPISTAAGPLVPPGRRMLIPGSKRPCRAGAGGPHR